MQDRVQLLLNGQELQTTDVNTIAKEASLADDRILAELLRLAPFNGSTYAKAVLPYVVAGTTNAATVQPGTGGVTINPFRAIVGSRTTAAVLATDNWNDIRSVVYVGSPTALAGTQTFAANASGNPRWDLLYAAVSSDANGATVTRYIKTPSTKVVAPTSVVGTLTTTVALGVVAGTPGAIPTFPALPTDTGATIYIPLAFVRIINGFTGATVLNNKDIYDVAPVVTPSRSTGAASLRPADQQNVLSGTAISGAGTSTQNGILTWTGTTNTRPGAYIPPSMVGTEALLLAMDFSNASSANWSHQSGAILDTSRDWRNRIFRWSASVGGTGGFASAFPWVNTSSTLLVGSAASMPGYAGASSSATLVLGLGASMNGAQSIVSLSASSTAAQAVPASPSNVPTNVMASSASVLVSVDGSGRLIVTVSGTPGCTILIWLEASAPYPNL